MTAFHLFPRLPWELRARIWELTVEPRTVEVIVKYELVMVTNDMRTRYDFGTDPDKIFWIYVLRLRSSTPVPAPLQACREARVHLTEDVGGSLGSYRKTDFHQLAEAKGDGIKTTLQPELRLELGLGPEPRRYVWLNFEMDMISIGERNFTLFKQYYRDIKRLKLARKRDESYDYFDHNALREFSNVRECHVVCLDGIDMWEDAEIGIPGDVEKILLIDRKTGETATPAEIEAKWNKIRGVEMRKGGARIHYDTSVPFVPWLPPGWFEGREEWDNYEGPW